MIYPKRRKKVAQPKAPGGGMYPEILLGRCLKTQTLKIPIWTAILVSFTPFLSACNDSAAHDSDTDSSAGPGNSDGGDGNADCNGTIGNIRDSLFDQTNNRLIVNVWDDYGEGLFSGSLFDGPDLIFHRETERIGACRLLTYDGNACDESCVDSDICIDGECQTPPSLQSAGPLRLTTSNGIDETLNPESGNPYYRTFNASDITNLDWAAVSLSELGSGISLKACIPGPIIPESDFNELLYNRSVGESVTLKWMPSTIPTRVYLHMTTCIGTHGGISPVEIECEAEDSGELTIPGAFLDALDCEGCWGQGECGNHLLIRSHTVEAAADSKRDAIQLRGQREYSIFYYPGFPSFSE